MTSSLSSSYNLIKELSHEFEPTVDEFIKAFPELNQFWVENFDFYLKKSIKRLNKNNYRRNFQGRVVDSLLTKKKPDLVLNLFSGYLGSFHSIFGNNYFRYKEDSFTQKEHKFIWINIDLLPESIIANCQYLESFWGIKSSKIPKTKFSRVSTFPNGLMFHLPGNLKRIDLLHEYWNNLSNLSTYQAIIGIEGIMNLPFSTGQSLMMWWNDLQKLITSSKFFFGSWMAAGKFWEGFLTKLVFYQEVVKAKHKQPFLYGTIEKLSLNKLTNSVSLFEAPLPWNIKYIRETLIPNISKETDLVIIKYYSSLHPRMKNLRFVSSYITEKALNVLLSLNLSEKYREIQGYKAWEEFFGRTNTKSKEESKGFVKILPFGYEYIEK